MGGSERNVGLAQRGSMRPLRWLLVTALVVLAIMPGIASAEPSKITPSEAETAQLDAALIIATGAVTDAQTGLPIAGAYVDAWWYSPNGLEGDFAGETETDTDGTFVLHDSVQRGPGWYSFYAEADGYDWYDPIWIEWDGETTLVVELELEPLVGPSTIDIQHDAAGVVFDRWVTGYSTAYSGDGYVYGRWPGTELSATFTGSSVSWIGPKQPSYGMADVYLDDVLVASDVDCYAPAGEATLSAVIWESGALADGPHTLSIRLTGARNAASAGNVVVVDRFEVSGLDPAGGGSRIDDTLADPGYAGSWIDLVNPTYYNKTYSYSRWTNATFTATFEGTKVAWIGPRTPNYGMADVFIDDVKVATVDAYRENLATQGWREVVWESDTLSPGMHTIKIAPTGTMNPSSTAANIVIDALDVTP